MAEADYLARLNPEQRAAVEHFEGPILVLAGAGSGKTRVLTTRIAHLIQEHGVDPRSILAVTFTNKAAAEMRARIRQLLEREPAGMWMGTFHSIGARLLRRHAGLLGWTPNFTIYDADEALRETKRALERLQLSPKRWSPQAVHHAISAAKNQLIPPQSYPLTPGDPFGRVVFDVYAVYQKALREQNAFDFDDLLVKPVELLREHESVLLAYRRRFGFVLVDEYQDTNHAQYVFLSMVAGGEDAGNLMVVGDDDQSIYGWRGADIRNILDFEKEFPNARLVRLEQNYRSTGRILDAANVVIAKNTRRKGKTLRTEAGPGDRLTIVSALDERDEADWIGMEIGTRLDRGRGVNPRDFVVLYRTNSQSRAHEEAFRRRDIPYQIVGGTRFYERREIMDLLAYLRLISNPRDAGAFDRIINYPRRGIGDTSRARMLEWALQQGLTALEGSARADACPELRGGAATAFVAFAGMIQRYTALAAHIGVGELVEKLIAEIGLIDALRDEGPEGADRIDNVNELLAGALDFDTRADDAEDEEDRTPDATPLDLFLQKVALLTDVDRHNPDVQAVTLMTVHNAKGLEFDVVFIAGMEDGLFPLARAFDEPDLLEEERRLFYVAITRAQRKVFISHVRTRRRAGEVMPARPSSFLDALPRELFDEIATPGLDRARRAGETRWSRRDGAQGVGSLGYRDRERSKPTTPRFDDDGGTWIDYSEAQEAPRFLKGERVRHPHFGKGVIRELSGFGHDLKAVIDFDGIGRKKVVVRHANLQKEL